MKAKKKISRRKEKEIKARLEQYIEEAEIPVIAEFAYLNNIRKEDLLEMDFLTDLLAKALEKKEAQLELKCLNGEIKPTMAMFSLKQLGWADRNSSRDANEIMIIEIPEHNNVD